MDHLAEIKGLETMIKILVVEDDVVTQKLVVAILEKEGYSAFVSPNGRHALEALQVNHFDLMITDVMMPELDGFSVMDILQKEKTTRDIPIIVITAKELTRNEKMRLQGRIQALLQKGDFVSEELLDEVKSVIK